MSEQVGEDREWARRCEQCGTALATAVVDFDKSNPDRPELTPGEMVAVDYCPNPDCPSHRPDLADEPSAPGSLGGDSGGG